MRSVYNIMIFSIAEAVRARFYVGLLAFAGVAVVAGSVLGGVPWGDVDQVILSLGWGAISVLSLALAILYTAQVVHRDRDRRVLFMILARPVSRFSYLLGKFLAMAVLLTATISIMALFLWGCVELYGSRDHGWQEFMWPTIWVVSKSLSMVGYVLAFSIVYSYLPALFLSGAVYVIGSSIGTALEFMMQQGNQSMTQVLKFVYLLFPNYDLMDYVARIVHDMAVPGSVDVIAACAYFIGYGLVALSIGALVFEYRDLD